MHISLLYLTSQHKCIYTMCEHIAIYQEDCEVEGVVGVCESGEKGGQESDDKTGRRHGRISNQDGKMEGGDQKGENMQGMR